VYLEATCGSSYARYRRPARASAYQIHITHVIRRTNQPLSATNDAETIDEATRRDWLLLLLLLLVVVDVMAL